MARWVWLLGLVCLGVAACARGAEPATATPCAVGGETAVLLALQDESGAPLLDVSLRYRVDDGAWQTLPERYSRTARIRGGPGSYLIEATKPGFQPRQERLVVPAADGCTPQPREATLVLAAAPCREALPLRLAVETPAAAEALAVVATLPGTGQQPLACAPAPGAACEATLPLRQAGVLTLQVTGLPDAGELRLADGVVDYAYAPYALTLAQGRRTQRLAGAGAARVTLALPVTLDEAGCPLAELRQVTVTPEPDRGVPQPAEVWLSANLLITNPGAAACQAAPEPVPLALDVKLPAGTRLADVIVEVRAGETWQAADCGVADGRYRCTAEVLSPLMKRPYAERVRIGETTTYGTSLPFDTLCMVFTPDTDRIDAEK